MSNATRDDPYLHALIGIGAELTAIRQELQRMNDRTPDPAAGEIHECRCGRVVHGEDAARRHAADDHGAPADAWEELYT